MDSVFRMFNPFANYGIEKDEQDYDVLKNMIAITLPQALFLLYKAKTGV